MKMFDSRNPLLCVVLLLSAIFFGGCATANNQKIGFQPSGPSGSNAIAAGKSTPIDGFMCVLAYSDLRDPKELSAKFKYGYELASAEMTEKFFSINGQPKEVRGLKPYVLKSVRPINPVTVMSAPSKRINGVLYMTVYSNIGAKALEQFLKQKTPLAFRFADDTEAEVFEKALDGQPRWAEVNLAGKIDGLERFIIARVERQLDTVALK